MEGGPIEANGSSTKEQPKEMRSISGGGALHVVHVIGMGQVWVGLKPPYS